MWYLACSWNGSPLLTEGELIKQAQMELSGLGDADE